MISPTAKPISHTQMTTGSVINYCIW